MLVQSEPKFRCSEEDLDASIEDESETNMDLILDSIKDIIDRLYKLATKIRNPSTRLTNSKAQYFKEIDEESGVDLLQSYAHFDRDYVSSMLLQYRKAKALEEQPVEKVSKVQSLESDADGVWNPLRDVLSKYQEDLKSGRESFLVARIARANMRRRQQFGYWKRHRESLIKHTQMVSSGARVQAAGSEARPPQEIAQVLGSALRPGVPLAPSVTTASRLNLAQLSPEENKSTMSISEYASSTWDPGKETVEFPPPPKWKAGKRFFDCPYCFTLCSNEILSEKAWK
jgi:hypothetical protein